MAEQIKKDLIALPEAKPFFSDNVIVSMPMRLMNETERETWVVLTFVNGNAVLSSITMTLEHAQVLSDLLATKVKEGMDFKHNGTIPKKEEAAKTEENLSYIG